MTVQAQDPSRATTESNCQEKVAEGDQDKSDEDGSEAVLMTRIYFNPVDKGWAWMILISVFVVQVNCIGMLRSLGIFFVPIQMKFNVPASEVSLIGGAQAAVFSICGLVTMTLLIDKMSVRNVARLGSLLCFAGLSLCYFADSIVYYYLFQSVLCGLGLSMIFGPGFVLLSTYFHRRRALAVAVANSGGSVGTLLFPLISRLLLEEYSLGGTYLLLGALFAQSLVFAGFYTPPEDYQEPDGCPDDEPRISDVGDVDETELALLGSTTLLGGDVKHSEEGRNVPMYLRPFRRVKNWLPKVSWSPSVFSIGSRVTPKGTCNGEHAKDQDNVADLESKPGYQPLQVESQPPEIVEEDLRDHGSRKRQGSDSSIHRRDSAGRPTRRSRTESVHFAEPDASNERQLHPTANIIPEIMSAPAPDEPQSRGTDKDVSVEGTAECPAVPAGERAVHSAGDQIPRPDTDKAAGKEEEGGRYRSTETLSLLDNFMEEFRVRAYSEGYRGPRTKRLSASNDGLYYAATPRRFHHVRSREGGSRSTRRKPSDEDRDQSSNPATLRIKREDAGLTSFASMRSQFSLFSTNRRRSFSCRRLSRYSMLYLSRETVFIPPEADMQIVKVEQLEEEEEQEEELSRMNACRRWTTIVMEIFFDISLFKSPSFWLMLFFHFFGYLGMNMPAAFVPPLAEEKGMDLSDAASLMIVLGSVDFVGRLLPGFMAHMGWLQPTTMVCVCYFINGVVFQLTSFFNSMPSLICMCAVNGFCAGCYVSMMQLITIDFVGLDRFAKAFGMVQMSVGFATAAFLPFLGALKDITGTYVISFHVIGACTLLSSALLLLAPFVKRHERGHEKSLVIKNQEI